MFISTDSVNGGATKAGSVPAGARYAKITVLGGGGRGGASVGTNIPSMYGGGGGGAGGVQVSNFIVTPSTAYSLVSGIPGSFGVTAGDSTFTIGSTILKGFGGENGQNAEFVINPSGPTGATGAVGGMGGSASTVPSGIGTLFFGSNGVSGQSDVFGRGGTAGIMNGVYGNGGNGAYTGGPGAKDGQSGWVEVSFYDII